MATRPSGASRSEWAMKPPTADGRESAETKIWLLTRASDVLRFLWNT